MPAVPITKIPDGMRNWCYDPPPYLMETVELWREGWTETRVTGRRDIHPQTNVYGLYWREPRAREFETTHAIN